MPKPDAKLLNASPAYLRSLIEQAGLTQRKAAEQIGITDRVMRYYLSDPASETYRPAPYVVQYALEGLTPGPTLQEWLDSLPSDQRATISLADVWEAARNWRKP